MEAWRDITGFDGYYQVSDRGNVRRLTTTIKHSSGSDCIKMAHNLTIKKGRYRFVILSVKGLTSTHYVHRIEAKAFIPNPENKPQVNHLDGDKFNNNLDNLEWCTVSENRLHSYAIGLQVGYAKKGARNRTKIAVRVIDTLYASGLYTIEVSCRIAGIHKTCYYNYKRADNLQAKKTETTN